MRSGEKAIDATFFNQSNQMPARAGAYDRRSPNNGNFAVIPMCASQFSAISRMIAGLGFLGVNNVIDELKGIGVGGGSLHRHNPDSLVSDNNLVAFFYVEKLNGSRSTFFLLNRYCAVDDPGVTSISLPATRTNVC
jgi:hypothetical protein